MKTSKTHLALGVASAAIAVGLAGPAHAACAPGSTTATASTITCSGETTANGVNDAVAAVTGSAASVEIKFGATVVEPDGSVIVPQKGVVSITNAGTLGTKTQTVGIDYTGKNTDAANTFTLANSGSVTGSVSVTGVGGTTRITNAGTIDGAVFVDNRDGGGAIAINGGKVAGGAGFGIIALGADDTSVVVDGLVGTPASATAPASLNSVYAVSYREATTSTPTTSTADGVTTDTQVQKNAITGKTAKVDVTRTGQVGDIIVAGVGGASSQIDGKVGSDTRASNVSVSAAFVGQQTTTTVNKSSATADSQTTSTIASTVGGDAAVAVRGGGSVAGQVFVGGLTSASVSIDGTVGNDGATGHSQVNAHGISRELTSSAESTASTYHATTTEKNSLTGGIATVAVGATGLVNGSVDASGDAGASATNAGTVTGTLSAASNEYVSNTVAASDYASATTTSDAETTSTTTSSSNSVSRSLGGAASITNAAGASVGRANVSSIGDGALVNDGVIKTGASVNATGSVNANSSTSADSTTTKVTETGTTAAKATITFVSAASHENTSNSASETNGGKASLTNGKTGRIGTGSENSVFVSGLTGASAANAGQINADLHVSAAGSSFTGANTRKDSFTGDVDGELTYVTKDTHTSTFQSTGGNASLDNTVDGTIGVSQDSPVDISVYAVKDASATNAGRINGNLSLDANGSTSNSASIDDYSRKTDRATGVVTVDTASTSNSATTATGGTASFANAATGLVVGSVDVNGTAGVTIANNGTVIRTTSAHSTGSASTHESAGTSHAVFTPGETGGSVEDTTSSSSDTSASNGGSVNGTYAGFNGALQFAPGTSGSDGSVSQYANKDSVALVTGTIAGSFTGSAVASKTVSSSAETTHEAYDASDFLTDFTSSTQYASATTRTGGNSTAVLGGGKVLGSVTLLADGNSSAELGNGAVVNGDLLVSGQSYGGNYGSTHKTTLDNDYTKGALSGYTSTTEFTSSSTALGSSATATIGTATIDGNVNVNGAKGGSTLSLAADGAIGGSAGLYAVTFDSQSTSTTKKVLGTTGLVTDTAGTYTSTANGGDVTATIDGTVGFGPGAVTPDAIASTFEAGGGSLTLYAGAGNASATLTGSVANNIVLSAQTSNYHQATSSHTDEAGTTETLAYTSDPVGGTATLDVNAPKLGVPANFGNISVNGLAGSTVNIGATSAVLAGVQESHLTVGEADYKQSFAQTIKTPAHGLAELHSTYTYEQVGGPAVLTNAGTVGFNNGEDTATAATVLVASVGGATATNSGKIFGSLEANAIGFNATVVTDSIHRGDVTRKDTTVTDYTATGGEAKITNTGLVTGNAVLAGATGSLANSGTIGGDVVLGQSVDHYVTTQVDTSAQIGTPVVTAAKETLFGQTYTVDQNGTVTGAIRVEGAFGHFENAEGKVKTSDIQATINLNAGSVTGGVAADYDAVTGERFTHTVVNLAENGKVNGRITGVETLHMAGTGNYTITGADYVPGTDTTAPAYTLDLGQFEIVSGEVQLATIGGGDFGIRGDVVNAASLVLGTRQMLVPTLFGSQVTSTGTETVNGVSIVQVGNFTQTSTGTVTAAMLPALVRVYDPAITGSQSNEPLGVQHVLYSQGLFTTPAHAFGSQFTTLTKPSSVTIEGNLDLGGTVNLLTPKGGLFVNGQAIDLFNVSGTVKQTAKVATNTTNNFVSFALVTRTEEGRTILSVEAARKSYATAGTTRNAQSAGAALTAALPDVVKRLQDDAAASDAPATATATASATTTSTPFTSVLDLTLTQDLATVMAGLDSGLTLAGATQALNELGGGSFYGSLSSVQTTAPFVDVLSNRRLPEGADGFNLWIQPTGDFARTDGNAASGASKIRSDSYGISTGFGVATGAGEFGLGFGYGRTDTHSDDGLARAKADSWMVGAYGRQAFGPLTVAGDIVFGWSNWDANRSLPTLSRKATAAFKSKEARGDLRVEYAVPMGGATLSPFGQVGFRHASFNAFDEEGAGAVGLAVQQHSKTVFTPTLGVKVAGEFETKLAKLRPEATISYSFKADPGTERDVAFLGATDHAFRLEGVKPGGYVTVQAGLFADIGERSGAFVRAGYSTGAGNNIASLRAGVTIGF